jgi:hypothetical protein
MKSSIYTPRHTPRELKKLENIHIQDKVSNDFMELKSKYNYKIFHLTITWNKTHLQENPSHLNDDFINLYFKYIIKFATNVKRISKNNRHLQPILVSFIDEGKDQNKSLTANCKKLHHHCLIAATDKTAERLESLCGLNTVKPMCERLDVLYPEKNEVLAREFKIFNAVCSSDLKLITNDEIQTRYPSKTLFRYDEQYMLRFNYPIDYDTLSSTSSEGSQH